MAHAMFSPVDLSNGQYVSCLVDVFATGTPEIAVTRCLDMKKRFSLDLDRSFFYGASGVDLQPLIRFSHLVNTFIYVNVGSPFACVVRGLIADKIAALQSIYGPFLELAAEPVNTHLNEIEHESLSADWQSILPRSFQSEYACVFGPFAHEENWALQFDLIRTVGKCRRPLRLFFINGEALATYLALTHNGRQAPKVFCSIQSGRLECQDSPMRQIWNHHKQVPDYWVRGLWGAERSGDEYWAQQAAIPVFCPVSPLPFFVQQYAGWSGKFDPKHKPIGQNAESSAISLVRTFSRKQLCPMKEVAVGSPCGRTRILRRRFKERSAHHWDVALVPDRLSSRWKYQNAFRDVPVEAIQRPKMDNSALDLPGGMKASLAKLDSVISNLPANSRVAFIPDAFEDEGALFSHWAGSRTSTCDVDMLLSSPLDYNEGSGDTHS
jgi:hypothetical protein